MDHTAALRQIAATYFAESLGLSFDSLLAPIASDSPAGKWLHNTSAYQALRRARHFDDDGLAMGAWEQQRQRADWPAVSRMAADVLCHQGKDLECMAWLLEARLHLDGFAAIAPCLTLLDALLNQYWGSLHPLPDGDGDGFDARANLLHWIAEKLLPVLRQTPLTASDGSSPYDWSDWEQGQRNSQHRTRMDGSDEFVESTELAVFRQAMTASSADHFLQLRGVLSDALRALDMLRVTLDRYFAPSPPSLSAMADLLGQIFDLCDAELYRRGVRPAPSSVLAPPLPVGESIRDRADAYARLAELSDYLLRIEPHSPLPHLLRHVVELGKLPTAQLYHELFLRSNGMVNVFELMGVETPDKRQ